MSRAGFTLLLLLWPAATIAQVTFTSSTDKADQDLINKALADMPEISTCPISLHARQTSTAFAREVGDSREKSISQRLHLDIASQNAKQIVAANVTVNGFANKARLMNLATNASATDAKKTLDVTFPEGKDGAVDVWVRGFSALRAVDLNSVTYADGSRWKLGASRSCLTMIDGMLLVGGR